MKKNGSLAAKLTLWLAVPVLTVTLLLCGKDLCDHLHKTSAAHDSIPAASGMPYHAGAEMDQMLFNEFSLQWWGDEDSPSVRIAVNDSGETVFRNRLGFYLREREPYGLLGDYKYGDTTRFVVVDEWFEWADIMDMGDWHFMDELHATGYDDGFYFYATSLEVKCCGTPARSWEAPVAPGPDSLSLHTSDTGDIRSSFPDYSISSSNERRYESYESAEDASAALAAAFNSDSVRWARVIAMIDSISDGPIPRREDAFSREDTANAFSPYLWQEITAAVDFPEFFTDTGLHIYTRVYEAPLSHAWQWCRETVLFRLFLAGVLLLYAYLLVNHFVSAPLFHCTAEAGHIVTAETWFTEAELQRSDELGELARTLKKAQAAFQEKWDSERALERKRQDFVAAASHDLKTPLALIGGYVEAVQQNIAPAENARYLDSIEREAGKMNRLVLEMLSYTRLDRMTELENGRRENLAALLGVWLDEAAPLFEGRSLARDLPERLFVRCDAALLRRAVDNLLSNAAKFTPKGGSVKVALYNRAGSPITDYLAGKSFCLSVENDGEPIPEGELERIFEMFYRTDRARTRGDAGNGVGLAAAKRICELHGFTLRAENTDVGVRFRIEG